MSNFDKLLASMMGDLMDRPIAFHRIYGKIMGSAAGGLFLSQLVYWEKKMGGKEFYKTQKDWIDETCLSRREMETSRKKLEKMGILETIRKGVPAKLYYKVNFVALAQQCRQFATSDKLENTPIIPSLSDVTNKNVRCDKQEGHILQTITETTQRLPIETTTTAHEADSAPTRYEYPDQPKEQPIQTAPARFTPMTPDWRPDDYAFQQLTNSRIPSSFANECLPEFVSYWIERGDNSRTWNNTFKKSVRKLWADYQANPPQNTPPAGQKQPYGGVKRSRDTTIAEDINDTSWAK